MGSELGDIEGAGSGGGNGGNRTGGGRRKPQPRTSWASGSRGKTTNLPDGRVRYTIGSRSITRGKNERAVQWNRRMMRFQAQARVSRARFERKPKPKPRARRGTFTNGPRSRNSSN